MSLNKLDEETIEEVEAILARLADSMILTAERLTTSVDQLQKEIREIRDTRYRPYFTTVGLFVATAMGVVGYTYQLENRTTQAFFVIRTEIAALATTTGVNMKTIEVNAERSLARQEHALARERIHNENHTENEYLTRELLDAVLALQGEHKRKK